MLETVGMSSMFSDVFECSWTFPMFLLTDMGINFGIGFLRIHHPKALSTLLHCCRARRIGLMVPIVFFMFAVDHEVGYEAFFGMGSLTGPCR